MWHEILYRVLSILSYVVLAVFLPALFLQVLEIFASFHRKVTFPKSEKKARIAYVIPAHNEASVIYATVESIFQSQKYPRECYEVYVIADNCTDETAELARKAGAKVLIHNDSDPSHHMALYPLRYGIDYILKNDPDAEIVIHLDADNHINPEFSQKMNDAYQTGIDFARPYEGGLNGTQNFFTKACSYFYAFDSRFGGRGKEVLHLSAHPNGSGAMMSRRMLLKTGGYDSTSISDDTEFSFNRMLEGVKAHLVEEAVVYEDMPSSGSDTLNRNARIAKGNKILMKTKTWKMIPMFFKTGDFSYLETFSTYSWVFTGGPFLLWVLAYYLYFFLYAGFAMNGAFPLTMFSTAYFHTAFYVALWILVGLVAFFYVLFGIVANLIFAIEEFDKFGAKKRSEFISMVLFFPIYLLVYGVSLMGGMFKKKNTWKAVKRNPNYGKK